MLTQQGFTASDVLDEFGEEMIDQIMLTEKWYRENMVPFQSLFEDQMFDIPMDADIKNDLRSLQMINGIIKLPNIRKKDTKNDKFFRHGDAAIALTMVSYAAHHIAEKAETYKPMKLKWL